MIRTSFKVRAILVPGFILLALVNSDAAVGVVGETVRGLADTVGFSYTAEQIEGVVRLSEDAELSRLDAPVARGPWCGAIAPHDDHLYAGRVYVNVMPGVAAGTVVVIGVAHHAGQWGERDRLIFDDFSAWRGPYGPIAVSGIRGDLLERMSPDDYVVSAEYHSEEHSIEGLLPFLQYYNRNVEIVPVLVPYMDWERLDELALDLGLALADISREREWIPGRDVAILISVDCVHYGDEGGGGRNYAPFGSDGRGFDLAVAREHDLIDTHLVGPVRPEKLQSLMLRLVDEDDVMKYRITWCGRFSVPFGLDCLRYFMEDMGQATPEGVFLRYGTSIDLGRLPLDHLGIGVTAPASLHHWVGYAAVGYR
jgi:AmmeMemoRadiSam system protein B